MKKKVHVVHHTHWDREWYFTTADAFVLSDSSFTKVLDELERNPQAKFCLDGQSSILEEYVKIRPERSKQIEKLVQQKRLEIGPWFTQTDTFFVNAESIIRNLAVGIKDSKKYGGAMKIGYLPDTFGFNAQMPTILQNCGIDNIIFWRGIHFHKHVESPYFIWKGLGGKKIYAVNLVDGYGTAAFLNGSSEYLQERLFPATEKIKNMTNLPEVLIPSGGDQLDMIENLPETVVSINRKAEDCYKVSTYEAFLQSLRTHKDALPEYSGEFREPCTARVHKSIGSVRYDIKRTNFLLEQKLLNRVEPLIAIAAANGITVSTELLYTAWKKLMEGHAHDSMGGCVADEVASDILHRMKEVSEMADGIENMIAKRLSERIHVKDNEIIVFNTLPVPFRGYKTVEFMCPRKNIHLKGYDDAVIIGCEYFAGKDNLLLETPEGPKYIKEDPYYKLQVLMPVELPAMGYKVIEYEAVQQTLPEWEKTDDTAIANEYYQLHYKDNQLELQTKFGKTFRNFIQFEDSANDGDTYDYSPLRGDVPVLLNLTLDHVKKTSQLEEMVLSGSFALPYRLSDRRNPNGETKPLPIELTIHLLKGSKLIQCRCLVDNQIYSHRLRVKINTDIFATETIASLPFGYIRRPVLNGEPENWQKEYVEMPIDIEPFDASVAVENGQYHVTAFSKGMKEYQFIKDSIYLTLFSTTSQLGKPNLVYRPGRASGDTTKKGHVMIPTPKAQLIGVHEFEFAFCVADGGFHEYQAAADWQTYTAEDISYQAQTLNKFVHRLDNKIQTQKKKASAPREFSLLEADSDSLFSSLSPSLYDKNSFLLRLKNPAKDEKQLRPFDFHNFKHVAKVNSIEEACAGEIDRIPAYDLLTIKLWM